MTCRAEQSAWAAALGIDEVPIAGLERASAYASIETLHDELSEMETPPLDDCAAVDRGQREVGFLGGRLEVNPSRYLRYSILRMAAR